MIIKRILKKIINYRKSSIWRKSITLYPPKRLYPSKKYKGNILLSYLTVPFYKKEDDIVFKTHTNHWECLQIAKIFLNLGYVVDVIHFSNKEFIPKKKYKVFIDIHSNMERISPYINKDCIKVLHITAAHWLFQNKSEYNRLSSLQKRRKVSLEPRRIVSSTLGIEYADLATILGNDFTISTFAYAGKPVYRIPLSTPILYDFPENKDYEGCRRNFLWLGSIGFVHKGLDLVLEAFSQMPDYYLTICGPIKKERDFEIAYSKELYKTPNINTVGWVYINSYEFKNILNNCIGVIYPSCSEGGGGSVITCMHAGLIPFVSEQASVDVEDFGFILKSLSVKEIKNSVRMVSNLSIDELKSRSKKTWNYARRNHTREMFAEEYEKFVKVVLKL